MFRRKVGIHGLIAWLVAYGVIDVALTVFYSWFPPLGSLVLVIGVAIGVWLNTKKFTERIYAELRRMKS